MAPGRYDLRFQGPDIETVVKKGYVVTPGASARVIADLKAGKGTRVIDYTADAGMEDELLVRIKKLEAALEALRRQK